MPTKIRHLRTASALVLVALLSCACSAGARASSSGAHPSARPSSATAQMDAFTCTSVQALLGHLAAGTARWSPTLKPFDPAVAVQIRTTSVNLQKQLPRVRTVAVYRAVLSSAKAFGSVATAMTQ